MDKTPVIPYDTSYTPPAPVLTVTLSGVVNSRPRATVPAIIDTAADITGVPAQLKSRLRLYQFSQLQLEDARGVNEPVSTYEVQLAIEGQHPTIIETILVPFPFVVLGRDWLQDYYLLLSGPEQQFLISKIPLDKR